MWFFMSSGRDMNSDIKCKKDLMNHRLFIVIYYSLQQHSEKHSRVQSKQTTSLSISQSPAH